MTRFHYRITVFLIIILSHLASVRSWAVPARRQIVTITLADGTSCQAFFCGDEQRSFLLTAQGYIIEQDETTGAYRITDRRPADDVAPYPIKRAGIGLSDAAAISPKGVAHIPVILVNFADKHMSVAGTPEEQNHYYDLFCNGTRDGHLYTGADCYGAVRDYFVTQSDSLFLPDFTVIGPVTLSKEAAYYGQNKGNNKDINFDEFCKEALELAIGKCPEFDSMFDNDGSGSVDMAFFIYAGGSEADNRDSTQLIWPKEILKTYTVSDIKIDLVGCCNELKTLGAGRQQPDGIGVMCHELSHSLGLADEYDTNYVGLGMSYWSLMDCGNYTKNGKTPSGFTTYQRDFLGWKDLTELTQSGTVRVKPLYAGGEGYKVVNPANHNEYYIIENRQMQGWDSGLAAFGSGLLIYHVDYDRSAWTSNKVNADASHQRMSFFPANNLYIGQYNATSAQELVAALSGQLYPGNTGNTELSASSQPASTIYTGGYMEKDIKQIVQHDDGTVTFKFMPQGVLQMPKAVECTLITTDGLEVSWRPVGQAECYRVELYGMLSEDDAVPQQLLATNDSVYATQCTFNTQESAYNKYKIKVMAQADCYEDSPVAESAWVERPTGITTTKHTGATVSASSTQVYTVDGQPCPANRPLKPGIYILRNGSATSKFVVR